MDTLQNNIMYISHNDIISDNKPQLHNLTVTKQENSSQDDDEYVLTYK